LAPLNFGPRVQSFAALALFAAQEAANGMPGNVRRLIGALIVLFAALDALMTTSDCVDLTVHRCCRGPVGRFSHRGRTAPAAAVLIFLMMAGALAGCSLSDGVGPYIIDPGRYSAYHCKELLDRLKQLVKKENELRNLIGKASEGGGGTVIGELAYRTDYEKALGEEKVLRRTAAEKKCDVDPPAYQSDQIIR
jgi:hypothetical protein